MQPDDKNLVKTLRKHMSGATVYGVSVDKSEVTPEIFNGAVSVQPLARVVCRSVADVQQALRIAVETGVPLSVLGGRHDPWYRGIRKGGLILDLRALSQVSVSPDADEVTVQGGATTANLLAALPDNLTTVTGTIKSIGVVGLTLVGGYGTLNSRFGLAADVVKRAQLILADGRLVAANDTDDAGLLWAIKGGGSGFGVVTSMTLATYRMRNVLSATIFFPLSFAKQALLEYQQMLDANADELSILAVFATGPSGDRGLFLTPLWTGEPALGERLVQMIAKLNGAEVIKQGWSTYSESFVSEEIWPWGRRYFSETQTIARIDEPAAEILVEAVEKMSSPKSILFLHDFHGAPTRVAADATAFPLRTNHFVIGIIAAWDVAEDHERPMHETWAKDVSNRISRVALQGGYVGFLNPNDSERVRLFYGASATRLQNIKRRVDPHDVFNCSTGHLR